MAKNISQTASKLRLTQLLLFMAVLLSGSSAAFAQTQLQLDEQYGAQYQKANAERIRIYKKILCDYKKETQFTEKLKQEEKAWIAYRDAAVAALYPDSDHAGSVTPMCYGMELTRLTKQHNKELQRWLDGKEEGDVCSGSIRFKSRK